MRRIIFALSAAILSGIVTTACQKENLSNIPEGAIMLTTEGFHGDGKTMVNDLSVDWVGGESVVINGTPYEVVVDGDNAYIDGSGITTPLYGYYACGTVTEGDDETDRTVTVPGSYTVTYDSDGNQVIDLPMVAYSTSLGNTIQFKHVTAAIQVLVRNEIEGTTLALDRVVVSSSKYRLSGTVPVTLIDNEAPTVAAQSGSGSVSVTFTDAPTIPYYAGNEDLYLAVQVPILPVGSEGNITVKVYAHDINNSDIVCTYTHTATLTKAIGRNEMLTAGCRVNTDNSTTEMFDPYTSPLTFEAMAARCTVSFQRIAGAYIQCRRDGSTWQDLDFTTNIILSKGEKVYFRAKNSNTRLAEDNTSGQYSQFSTSKGGCYVYGNVMSLLNQTNYATATQLTDDYAFRRLFYGCTYIYNHPTKKLVLPATMLSGRCYLEMFHGCSNLTTAPELPATTLATSCYAGMFWDCTRLTTTPELPATTLANTCYEAMFYGCTSLTTAPELPATVLAEGCYMNMFRGCSHLTTAPELPATTLATSCYAGMFWDCKNLTTTPELPATTLAEGCYIEMFRKCSYLTTAPELPATTLAKGCYAAMFYGCKNLTAAPELPATTLAEQCYQVMFYDCTNLSSITCLATDISASNCLDSWVYNVASTGTFTKAASMSGWTPGASGIPSGWTVTDATSK